VQWLRDGLRLIAASAEVETLPLRWPIRANVLFRAGPLSHGRAVLGSVSNSGISRGTTGPTWPGGAGVDGLSNPRTCWSNAEGRRHSAGPPKGRRRGSVNNLLMQFPGDVLGVPVCRPQVAGRRPWGGVPRRAGRRVLAGPGRTDEELGHASTNICRQWLPPCAMRSTVRWRRPWRGRYTGTD